MPGSTIILLVVIGIGVIGVIWFIVIYNGLVRLRNQVRNAWSQIDVQLKRRHDLIPNLVETVKGYAKHESGTLEAVIQARNQAVSAKGPAQAGADRGVRGRQRVQAVRQTLHVQPRSPHDQRLPACLPAIEQRAAGRSAIGPDVEGPIRSG